MDEWGLEALELKAWMVILGTKIGENSNTHKLIGELGGFRRGHGLELPRMRNYEIGIFVFGSGSG